MSYRPGTTTCERCSVRTDSADPGDICNCERCGACDQPYVPYGVHPERGALRGRADVCDPCHERHVEANARCAVSCHADGAPCSPGCQVSPG